MNERRTLSPDRIKHTFKKKLPANEPRVDVIVINSRQESNPKWVESCLNSIKTNTYGNIGLITVWNENRSNSIGQCWNAAVARSTAKYVMFVGDDDIIAPTLIHDLVYNLRFAKTKNAGIVAASSFMTMIDEKSNILGTMPNPFTGLFEREAIYNNPFDESLKNNVDTELFERFRAAGLHIALIKHCYGYYYRRHKNMVSDESRFQTPLPSE